MASIEQSIVREDVWFVKVGDTSIKTDENEIRDLIRSAMSTEIGKTMLREYLKRINKK